MSTAPPTGVGAVPVVSKKMSEYRSPPLKGRTQCTCRPSTFATALRVSTATTPCLLLLLLLLPLLLLPPPPLLLLLLLLRDVLGGRRSLPEPRVSSA